jgi:hypothetical protein
MFLRPDSFLSSGFFKQFLIIEEGRPDEVSMPQVYGGTEKETGPVRARAPAPKRKRKTPQKIIPFARYRKRYTLQRCKLLIGIVRTAAVRPVLSVSVFP